MRPPAAQLPAMTGGGLYVAALHANICLPPVRGGGKTTKRYTSTKGKGRNRLEYPGSSGASCRLGMIFLPGESFIFQRDRNT